MRYLLNVRQTLTYLNVTEEHLRRLVAEDGLPVVRLGTELRFRTSDLEPWIQSRAMTASRDPEIMSLMDDALDALDREEPNEDDSNALLEPDPYLFFVRQGELVLSVRAPHEAQLLEDQILGVMQVLDVPGKHALLLRKCLDTDEREIPLCLIPDRLKSNFSMITTPDRMHAFIFISENEDSESPASESALLERLSSAGIVQGLDMAMMRGAGLPQARGKLLHIARGAAPHAKGEPRVLYNFETTEDFKPRVMEASDFDMSAYRGISNAAQGQLLAEIILPEGVRDGIDVFGESVSYGTVVRRLIKSGPNTYLSRDGLRLHAAHQGIAYWKNGAVCVDSTRFLPSVGYETGNVDFDGRVIVQGNVIRGFSVSARRKIIIKGQVEADVHIAGGSSIQIFQGIKGGGTTRVEADSTITVPFAERCELHSRHNIHIETSAVRCRIAAAKSISVFGNVDARVVASSLTAGQSIRVQSAGAQNHEPVLLKIEQLTDDLAGPERLNLQSLVDRIHQEIKYSKTRIRRFKEQGSQAVAKEENHLAALHKLLEKEEEALTRFLNWVAEEPTIFVEITGTAFPGVIIQIEDKSLEINKPMNATRFVYSDQGIIAHLIERD